jgi:hypothetical protein
LKKIKQAPEFKPQYYQKSNWGREDPSCLSGPVPVIPALRMLRQEDHKFKANLSCIERPCLKKQTTTTKTNKPERK